METLKISVRLTFSTCVFQQKQLPIYRPSSFLSSTRETRLPQIFDVNINLSVFWLGCHNIVLSVLTHQVIVCIHHTRAYIASSTREPFSSVLEHRINILFSWSMNLRCQAGPLALPISRLSSHYLLSLNLRGHHSISRGRRALEYYYF